MDLRQAQVYLWRLFGALVITAVAAAPIDAMPFLRADVNGDGVVNITDPIFTLEYLFTGAPEELACEDAADANDDGEVNLADAVATLLFLFGGGFSLPEPLECGDDPTDDATGCASFPMCDDAPDAIAEILDVRASGAPGAYSFAVTVASPDTGCAQYADWWEVVSPGGALIHRRVLAHSHVGEQPFTRSSAPIAVLAETEVIVRAHMNTSGYGRQAMRGSVGGGFESVELESGFAAAVETEEPLPTSCAF